MPRHTWPPPTLSAEETQLPPAWPSQVKSFTHDRTGRPNSKHGPTVTTGQHQFHSNGGTQNSMWFIHWGGLQNHSVMNLAPATREIFPIEPQVNEYSTKKVWYAIPINAQEMEKLCRSVASPLASLSSLSPPPHSLISLSLTLFSWFLGRQAEVASWCSSGRAGWHGGYLLCVEDEQTRSRDVHTTPTTTPTATPTHLE